MNNEEIMIQEEPKTYAVYEGHMDTLRKKITKIQNKCKKYGCDFSYKEVGEEFKEIEHDGENFVIRYVLIQTEGTAVVNDWEFVASVEHTSAGNIFSKAKYNVEIPMKYRTTDSCICEHCKSKRIRNHTAIIRHIHTGEFKQIGSTCLKDFTGGMSASTATWFASVKDVFQEVEDMGFGSFGWYEKSYETKEVLQYTAETIRHFGFSKSEDGTSTKTRMNDFFAYLHGNTRWWSKEDKERVKNLIDCVGFNPDSDEAVKMTEDALAWIAEQEATNDYMHNLKVVTSLRFTKSDRFGLLVSLFPTYNRDLELQDMKRKEAEQGKLSKHVGQVGDRLEITVDSVKCLTSWESCYNGYTTTTTFIWKIVDIEGNVFTWKTSTWLNEELPPVKIKGTVKEHKEFRGVLQTELTRCKILKVA